PSPRLTKFSSCSHRPLTFFRYPRVHEARVGVRVTDVAMLGALRRLGRSRMYLITGVVMLGSVAVTAGGAIALARELPAWRGRLAVTRATRLIDDGDYTAAIRTLLGAVAATPRDARVHYYLGLARSEEHTSELQSRGHLVCRLLLA